MDAANINTALLLAGNRLGLEGIGMIDSSVQVSVTRRSRNGFSR